MSKAQGQIGDIPRNRTVTVQPRSGGTPYQFKYATLSAIMDAIRKPLSDNGLAYTQVLSHDADAGFFSLTTTLYHGDQFLSSKVPLIQAEGSNQQFGSALTYMKRYALAAMLGLAADEDDDGNAADGNEVKSLRDTSPKPPAADPISTGKPKFDSANPPVSEMPQREAQVQFSTDKIDVPLTDDESGSDWMMWGMKFMAMARSAPDAASLDALRKSNTMPLKNMELQAPKMYAKMTLALVTLVKQFEKEQK